MLKAKMYSKIRSSEMTAKIIDQNLKINFLYLWFLKVKIYANMKTKSINRIKPKLRG